MCYFYLKHSLSLRCLLSFWKCKGIGGNDKNYKQFCMDEVVFSYRRDNEATKSTKTVLKGKVLCSASPG